MATKTTKTTKTEKTCEQSLSHAKTKVNETKAAVEAAALAAEDLRDRLSAGDDSVSTDDLLRAGAEKERTALLASAAEKALARTIAAQRAAVSDLANVVAPMLADATGLPVQSVLGAAEGEPEALPSLLVVQTKPSVQDTVKGLLSGRLTLQLHRSKFHRGLDVETIEKALNRQVPNQLSITPGGEKELPNGTVVETYSVNVTRVAEALPVLATATAPTQPAFFGQFVKNSAQETLTSRGGTDYTGVRIGSGTSGYVPRIYVSGGSFDLIESKVQDGQRVASYRVSLQAQNGSKSPLSNDDMGRHLQSAVEAQVGDWFSGLGRVTQVRNVTLTPGGIPQLRNLSAVFDLTCRIA